jgi:hypothetical protein
MKYENKFNKAEMIILEDLGRKGWLSAREASIDSQNS